MVMRQIRELSAQAKRLILMRFLVYTGFQSSYFIGIVGTLTYSDQASVASTSFAVALMNVFFILGSFAGGLFLDAAGPRRHFFITGSAIVLAGFGLFFFGDIDGILWAGAAGIGFLIGATQVVATSYPVYLTDDPGELKSINSAMTLLSNVSVVAGPAIGGVLAGAFGSLAVFPFMSLCAAAGLLMGLGFAPPRSTAAPATHAEGDEATPSTFFDSVRFVATHGVLSLLFWVIFLANFGYGAFDPLESFFYRDVLHVGVAWMGYLSSAAGVGGVVGSLLVMRLSKDAVRIGTLLWALMFMGIGCLVYVGTPFVTVALVGQITVGIGWGSVNPLHSTIVQTAAPLEMMGRVNSLMTFGSMVAGVVPLLIAPWLAGVFGVQQTLVGASAVVAMVPACMLCVRACHRARHAGQA